MGGGTTDIARERDGLAARGRSKTDWQTVKGVLHARHTEGIRDGYVKAHLKRSTSPRRRAQILTAVALPGTENESKLFLERSGRIAQQELRVPAMQGKLSERKPRQRKVCAMLPTAPDRREGQGS